LRYGFDIYKSCVERLIQDDQDLNCRQYVERITELVDPDRLNMTIYSTSFCTNGDLLSQWRGYARGGGGYSIGLKGIRSWLADKSVGGKSINTRGGFVRIHYDGQWTRDQMDQVLKRHFAILKARANILTKPDDIENEFQQATHAAGVSIVFLSLASKDPAFSEENEWRLVVTLLDADGTEPIEPLFRATSNYLVPFIPITLLDDETQTMPIQSIVVGPTLKDAAAVRSVERFIKLHGHPNVVVTLSAIPLR
jgi:hypothetical protein